MSAIYLDHAATTPIHPVVLEAMLPYFGEQFGNPSSIHFAGRTAKNALDDARERIAHQLGCQANELIFTSGGTESDNMAIFGLAGANSDKRHVITTSVEHHAVLRACQQLERLGYDVTYLNVDRHGQISLDELIEAISPNTALISVIYGNNETGTLQPIEAIGRIAMKYEIPFHTDAVQSLGALPDSLHELPVQAVSLSAHKIGGPKGIGLLYVSKSTKIDSVMYGGSQEYGRRAGTENVPAIVGFAKALEHFLLTKSSFQQHCNTLAEAMTSIFSNRLDEQVWVMNGHPMDKLAHIFNISLLGVDNQSMLMNLDMEGIAVSAGSACSSGSIQPSHVLQAMQLSKPYLNGSIRFSFGHVTQLSDVRTAANKTATIYERLTSI